MVLRLNTKNAERKVRLKYVKRKCHNLIIVIKLAQLSQSLN